VFGLTVAVSYWQELPRQRPIARGVASKLLLLTSVLLLAWIVPWSAYQFRFDESFTQAEVFNRRTAEKIDDLPFPSLRSLMFALMTARVAPRDYLWGWPIRCMLVWKADPI
jgi:hypothetical protein